MNFLEVVRLMNFFLNIFGSLQKIYVSTLCNFFFAVYIELIL